MRRGPIVLVVVALLAAGALLDRRSPPATVESGRAATEMATAAPKSALSSTWYCQGASASPNGMANGTVIVANPTDRDVTGSVTFVASDPKIPPKAVPLDLKRWSRAGFAYSEQQPAPWVAALVEVDHGGVVAEQSVSGPLGLGHAPCASSASARWYFADGGTTRDAQLVYTLYNPFPEDAIVDLSFSTDQGAVVPQALQGVVVPAHGMLPINLNDHVLRRRAISASITARTGRIVAARLQTYDGTGGRKGLTLVPGAPSPGTQWWFPEGYVTGGMIERYQVYNPHDKEARLSIDLTLDRGSAEPFEIVVPPNGRYTMRVNDEARVPKDIGHAASITSENGVSVVVERSIDAGKPAPRSGLASTMGARATATQWAFASGLATKAIDEWIVLQNPGASPAKVSFVALAAGQALPLDGLQDVVVAAHGRAAVRLGDHVQRDDLGLLVTSTQPVVVERGLYRAKGLGMSITPGVPLQ